VGGKRSYAEGFSLFGLSWGLRNRVFIKDIVTRRILSQKPGYFGEKWAIVAHHVTFVGAGALMPNIFSNRAKIVCFVANNKVQVWGLRVSELNH